MDKKKSVPQTIQPPKVESTPMKFWKKEGSEKPSVVVNQATGDGRSSDEALMEKWKATVGVGDSELAVNILHQGAKTIEPMLGLVDSMNIMAQSLNDLKPRDAVEARLVAQSAALYTYAMDSLRRCGQADMLMHIEAMANLSIKFIRVHNETIEALNRYRRGGEQKVTVTHAVIAGQAIVNNFQGEGVTPKNQGETPCQQYAEPKPDQDKMIHVPSQQWSMEDVGSMAERVQGQRQKKVKGELR